MLVVASFATTNNAKNYKGNTLVGSSVGQQSQPPPDTLWKRCDNKVPQPGQCVRHQFSVLNDESLPTRVMGIPQREGSNQPIGKGPVGPGTPFVPIVEYQSKPSPAITIHFRSTVQGGVLDEYYGFIYIVIISTYIARQLSGAF